MLSAGYLSLANLKARLLPAAAAAETTWDVQLTGLGLAVAQKLARHCNRDFDRAVSTVETLRAQQAMIVLRRYPVESVASVVLVDPEGETETIDSGDYIIRQASGLLQCAYAFGDELDQIRITYTGGYWLDDGTTKPAAAAALPADVIDAWVLQCQAEAEHRELFRTVALRREQRESGEAKLTELGIIDSVAQTLAPYRRIAG